MLGSERSRQQPPPGPLRSPRVAPGRQKGVAGPDRGQLLVAGNSVDDEVWRGEVVNFPAWEAPAASAAEREAASRRRRRRKWRSRFRSFSFFFRLLDSVVPARVGRHRRVRIPLGERTGAVPCSSSSRRRSNGGQRRRLLLRLFDPPPRPPRLAAAGAEPRLLLLFTAFLLRQLFCFSFPLVCEGGGAFSSSSSSYSSSSRGPIACLKKIGKNERG